MAEIPVLDHDAVLEAVDLQQAIDSVADAFLRHHRGEWRMPSKVYVVSEPHGDFRAMPAWGDGLALLKWITSFPSNPARGLPTVTGVVLVSDAQDGRPLMLLDARSVTALRTGAAAAVAARALARRRARTRWASWVAGRTGFGRHARWRPPATGRACAADPRTEAARALADVLGWEGGLARRGGGLRRRVLRHAGRRGGAGRRLTCARGCT